MEKIRDSDWPCLVKQGEHFPVGYQKSGGSRLWGKDLGALGSTQLLLIPGSSTCLQLDDPRFIVNLAEP